MNAVPARTAVRACRIALLAAAVLPFAAQARVIASDSSGTVQLYGAPDEATLNTAMPGFGKLDGYLYELAQYAANPGDALTPTALSDVEPSLRYQISVRQRGHFRRR
jgi:hypothetical protein